MRTLGPVALLSVLLLSTNAALAQSFDARVEALMDEYDVPGLSLAIVTRDSTVLASWGQADSAGTIATTADTPFRIASVAKVFVAATALIEASRGRIQLDEDVSRLVPLEGRFTGRIRLHDLLTHSAGFDERIVGYAARSSDEMIPLRTYLENRMPARGWPVGEQICYSNHGFALAALAMETAANKPFAEIARDDLFEPLGMNSTGYLTRGDDPPPDVASPLDCADGACRVLPQTYSNPYPAGLAFSTGRDMSRFISALLRAGVPDNPLLELIPTRFSNDDRLPGMSYGFFHQVHGGKLFLSHAGSVPGYWSLLLVSREAGFGFFFAVNGGSARFGEQMRDVILDEYLETKRDADAAKRDNAPVSPVQSGRGTETLNEHASQRAGSYELTRYSHATIERFPELFQNTIQLAARGDTLVVYAGGSSEDFIPVEEGLYESLNGSDRLAFGVRRGKPRLFRNSVVYGSAIPAAYEKLPWYEAPGFLNEYVSWLLVVPLLLLFVLWPVGAAVGSIIRRKKGAMSPSLGVASIGIWIVAATTTLLFAVFGFRFIAQSVRLFESGEIAFGMPPSLAALTWMPLAHAVFASILCVQFLSILGRDYWGISRRIFYLVVVGLVALQVVFLESWNYLPAVW